jgi:aminomethyltransferase
VLVGLEIEGNVPAEHAIVYHRKKKEVGIGHRRNLVADRQAQHRHRQPDRPYGDRIVDDLWVEIYAMRELQYVKMMKRAKIVPRPFVKLDRRTGRIRPGIDQTPLSHGYDEDPKRWRTGR